MGRTPIRPLTALRRTFALSKEGDTVKTSVRNALLIFFAAVILGSFAVTARTIQKKRAARTANPNVTWVTAPDQTDFEVHPDWTLPEPEAIDYGENLALGKPVTQNGSTQIYQCRNAVDGDRFTYWEGAQEDYPNIITVDLEEARTVSGIGILLNPRQIWSARTQDVEIQGSLDGETFETLLPCRTVEFDPLTDNRCYLPLEESVQTRYVRFVFTANTGAKAGQAAEVEIYGAKGND